MCALCWPSQKDAFPVSDTRAGDGGFQSAVAKPLASGGVFLDAAHNMLSARLPNDDGIFVLVRRIRWQNQYPEHRKPRLFKHDPPPGLRQFLLGEPNPRRNANNNRLWIAWIVI